MAPATPTSTAITTAPTTTAPVNIMPPAKGKRKAKTMKIRKKVGKKSKETPVEKPKPRPLIKERALEYHEPFKSYIDQFGWGKVTGERKYANEEWVYQFYAALKDRQKDSEGFVVTMYGRSVDFSATAINEYFGLIISDDNGEKRLRYSNEFTNFDESNHQEDVLGTLLASEHQNASFEVKWSALPRGWFNPVARSWMYFVNSCLMPSKHSSTVQRKKAHLTYAIMKGWGIDVGKIINQEILLALSAKDGLPFPQLITQLCLKAGIQEEGNLTHLNPGQTIKLSSYLPKAEARVRQKQLQKQVPLLLLGNQEGVSSELQGPIIYSSEDEDSWKCRVEEEIDDIRTQVSLLVESHAEALFLIRKQMEHNEKALKEQQEFIQKQMEHNEKALKDQQEFIRKQMEQNEKALKQQQELIQKQLEQNESASKASN